MEYFKIGKLVAAYGVKGEMILKHSLGKKSDLRDLKALFIEEKRQAFIPWFIQAAKIKSDDETYIQFEEVESREAAIRLTQKEVWVTEADFSKIASPSSPLSFLGYHIIDADNNLGPILELIEQPHQLLCRLQVDDKEVLIPLNDQTLQKIDQQNKKVYVALPDGLLDIYLNP